MDRLGRLDFEAALQYVSTHFPGQPIHVAAHSVGGFLIGLAASSHRISRVFTMGAQYAYWRDYVGHKRGRMFLRWHVLMPALTALFGYFPGARLGWLEDTPRGVVRDWTARHPRFEENWARLLPAAERRALLERFAAMRGDTLAVSLPTTSSAHRRRSTACSAIFAIAGARTCICGRRPLASDRSGIRLLP